MKQKQKRNAKGGAAKSVLRLPDLEVAKFAVLNSLSCPDSQRGYRHAIDEFIEWYCSEPRLTAAQRFLVAAMMRLRPAGAEPWFHDFGCMRHFSFPADGSPPLALSIRHSPPCGRADFVPRGGMMA